MAKTPFNINKNEQYIECHHPFKLPNGKYSGIIRVYELLKPSKVNMLTTMDWSFQPIMVDPKATTGYNSLQIDGQLVDLEKLVQDLCKSRLRVNKLGYCYFPIMRGVADTTETYGFAFYRLNDMLKWSDYGVSVKLNKSDTWIVWDRLHILNGSTFDTNETHQKDKNDSVNDQQKAENQKLTNRVKELEAQLGQQKAQNTTLTGKVKELEAKVELYVPKIPNAYYLPATSPVLIDIDRQPDYPQRSSMIAKYWDSRPDVYSRTFTPTSAPVMPTTTESYREFSITLKYDQGFDTNNWYFVGVTENSTHILVYEGTKYSVNVGGRTMSSPIDGSAYFSYTHHVVFGPVNLAGIGYRIAISPAP